MSSYPLDRISYEIGMINCFIEMVACGVKPLAISPPIEPENLPVLEEVSRELSEGFGTKYYVDLEMMITDIQSADFTRGKHSIFYYKDDAVIRRYKELKEQVAALTAEGRYSGPVRRKISVEFGEMLGYLESVIHEKVDGDRRIDPVTL